MTAHMNELNDSSNYLVSLVTIGYIFRKELLKCSLECSVSSCCLFLITVLNLTLFCYILREWPLSKPGLEVILANGRPAVPHYSRNARHLGN